MLFCSMPMGGQTDSECFLIEFWIFCLVGGIGLEEVFGCLELDSFMSDVDYLVGEK